MRYIVTIAGKEHVVELPSEGGPTRTILIDGVKHEVNALPLPGGAVSLIIDGHSYDVDTERAGNPDDALDPRINLRVRGEVFKLEVMEERRKKLRESATRAGGKEGPATVTSPMPGKVVKILKPVGTEVKPGDGIIVVEAMKMENELRSPTAGTVKEIKVKEGQAVESGAVLVVVG